MGLADDKKNIFTTIGAYTSLNEEQDLPETSNAFNSINNSNDIGSFLIDILGVTVGTTALQSLAGELLTNFADSAEPKLKAAVKKQLTTHNSGDELLDSFKDGVSIPAKDIDVSGKLKTNPTSDGGKLLYSDNTTSFDKKAYQAISNVGTDIEYNNLSINYNSTSDSLKFKPATGSENSNIGDWINNYIDNTEFLNKKEFATNTLNNIFGSVSANQDKSIEELTEEIEINKLMEQFISGDDSFTLSEDELTEALNKAQELKTGTVNYDMGCGIVETKLPLDELSDLVSDISNSTDPNAVGNAIGDKVDQSFGTTDNEDANDNNKETIRNGFFARLLDFIKLELVKAVTLTPQSRMLFALSSSFQNEGVPQIGNPKEDLAKFKTLISCLIKEALALLHEFIFSLILTFLVRLISPIIKKIIVEKINQYIGIVKSLISSDI